MRAPAWLRLAAPAPNFELEDGTALRLLSAMEVLEARREAAELAAEDRERALCSNACLLARALHRKGVPVYDSGREVLERLTVSRIQDLASRWAEFDRRENPGPNAGREAVERIKKA